MRKEEIMEAYLDRYDLIVVYIHEQFYQGKSDTFRLRDSKGNVQNLIIKISIPVILVIYTIYLL